MILASKIEDLCISFLIFNLIFFHIFNLKINFPPYNLILICAFLSISIIFLKKFKINLRFFVVLFFIVVQFLILLISFLVNQNLDFYFFKEIILYELISLLSGYFIINCFFSKELNGFTKVSYFIFSVVVFQLILSFFGYLNGNIFNILFSFFNLGDQDIVSQLSKERMVGIGASFFGSGVINCLILVLVASFIVTETDYKNKFKLLLIYFIVTLLGMLSARTTSVGVILSLSLILLNLKNIKLKFLLLSLLLFLLFLLSNIKNFSDTKIGNLLNFSVGFLINFQGSNAANSTSDLLDMYTKLPNNIKTWVIGDSLYRDGYGYYKGTDIGYFRLVFATGIIGAICYFLFTLYLIFSIRSDRITFFAKVLIAFLFFILMGKGVAIFFPILLLLYFASSNSFKQIKHRGFN